MRDSKVSMYPGGSLRLVDGSSITQARSWSVIRKVILWPWILLCPVFKQLRHDGVCPSHCVASAVRTVVERLT